MKNYEIIIVEDEKELCELMKYIIEDAFKNISCRTYSSWSDVVEINDKVLLVISDSIGVGTPKPTKSTVIKISGDPDINPDFLKPFNLNLLLDRINVEIKKVTDE